jgi:Cobalamin-5-phosphate synthase
MTLQFDNYLVILLSLAITYYLFNLFHFDGFLDSIDGLLSQKSKDATLEIMRKGNTGPSGIFFGIIYILIKIFLMEKIYVVNLLAMFVLSRWGLSFACVAGPPARNEGLGNLFLGAKHRYFFIATLYVVILPFICTVDILFILASALSVIAVDYLVIIICTKKIDGITGDILGFLNEINELLVLIVLYNTNFS